MVGQTALEAVPRIIGDRQFVPLDDRLSEGFVECGIGRASIGVANENRLGIPVYVSAGLPDLPSVAATVAS
jgi:hypothetical protein